MESPEDTGDDLGLSGAEKRAQPKSEIGYYSMLTSTTADGRIMVGENIEIFPNKPRPDLASLETQAYEAKDRRLGGEQFALFTRNSRVPRVTSIASYKNLKSPNIVKLLDAGLIDWAPENREKLVFIFQMPGGRKMLEAPEARPQRLHEDRLVPGMILPILKVLQEFRMADLMHGAVCLDNIFLTGQEGAETVVLGECLSTAALFRLPAVYQTITHGMAQSSGRGAGTIADDIYALGMCVAMVVRGVNIAAGKSPQEIVQAKMAQGSYSFAAGGERLPGGLGDFLRGTLNDDEDQRWGLEEAMRWAEGRRIPSKQQFIAAKAARPYIFREEKYWDLRSVAVAFAAHVHEAAKALEKGSFSQWLTRNFDDQDVHNRIEKVWEKEQGANEDRLVAAMCMALDPYAPVRYKGLSIFPTGLGVALAEAISRQDEVQAHAEMVAGQMFNNWIQQRFDEIPDATGILMNLEKCRNFLVQKMPVYGVERVLYMLEQEVVCMSPLLRNYVVLDPGSLLRALEDISSRNDRPENLLDRHMMAFISVREPKMIDPHLGHLISRDRSYQLIGVTRTLALIQRRFNTGPMPGVGNWLISLIGPAIDRYKDRDLRAEVTKRMNKLQDTGDLMAILNLIDNAGMVQEDVQRFVLARREYSGLLRERVGLEMQLRRRDIFGRSTGRQVAMLMSVCLSSLCIVGYLFLRLVG